MNGSATKTSGIVLMSKYWKFDQNFPETKIRAEGGVDFRPRREGRDGDEKDKGRQEGVFQEHAPPVRIQTSPNAAHTDYFVGFAVSDADENPDDRSWALTPVSTFCTCSPVELK